jgi:hypothetical protein
MENTNLMDDVIFEIGDIKAEDSLYRLVEYIMSEYRHCMTEIEDETELGVIHSSLVLKWSENATKKLLIEQYINNNLFKLSLAEKYLIIPHLPILPTYQQKYLKYKQKYMKLVKNM